MRRAGPSASVVLFWQVALGVTVRRLAKEGLEMENWKLKIGDLPRPVAGMVARKGPGQ